MTQTNTSAGVSSYSNVGVYPYGAYFTGDGTWVVKSTSGKILWFDNEILPAFYADKPLIAWLGHLDAIKGSLTVKENLLFFAKILKNFVTKTSLTRCWDLIKSVNFAKTKLANEIYDKQLFTAKKCRITNINPGYTHTDLIARLVNKVNMLSPEDVANTVKWIIEQPKHIEIGDIGIWHPSER